MPSLPWSLLLLLSLAACGDKDGDEDDDGAPDGGAVDGGAADGGGGDGGGGGGGGSACPDYMGVGGVGSWREYRTTSSYEEEYGISGSYTSEVAAISGEVVRVRMDSDYRYADGGRALTSSTFEYRCDGDGAALTSYLAEGSYDGPTTDYSWTQETIYSDPQLAMIPDAATGAEWTDTWASTTTSWTSLSGDSTSSSTGRTTYRVGADSSATVPAGTFPVRRFESTTIVGDSSVSSSWLAERDLGQVQSDYTELVDYGG